MALVRLALPLTIMLYAGSYILFDGSKLFPTEFTLSLTGILDAVAGLAKFIALTPVKDELGFFWWALAVLSVGFLWFLVFAGLIRGTSVS